jgi:hypothetical protein
LFLFRMDSVFGPLGEIGVALASSGMVISPKLRMGMRQIAAKSRQLMS